MRRRLEELAGAPVEAVHYLDVRALDARPVVLSGSGAPWAAHDRGDLGRLGEAVRACPAPVLGICAGMQLLATFDGGELANGTAEERGYMPLEVLEPDGLLRGLPATPVVFQDHTDEIAVLPPGLRVLARTPRCAVQAVAHQERRWWGTQFHPEVWDDAHPDGERVLRTFFELAAE